MYVFEHLAAKIPCKEILCGANETCKSLGIEHSICVCEKEFVNISGTCIPGKFTMF